MSDHETMRTFLQHGRDAQQAVNAAIDAAGHQGTDARRRIDTAILSALSTHSAMLRYSMFSEAVQDLRATIREYLFQPEARRHVQNYAAELDAEARGKSYVILDAPEAAGGHAILCLRCRVTSYHPGDVENLWCASCNAEHAR